MRVDVVMPQMGESIAEGTITRWMKQVGDTVGRDEPLFEISTDKVDAEIPSPAAGRLVEIKNAVGETVPVNQVVAILETDATAALSATPAASAAPTPAPAPKPAPAPAAAAPVAAKTPAAEPAAPRGEGTFVSPVVRKIASEHGIAPGRVRGTGAGADRPINTTSPAGRSRLPRMAASSRRFGSQRIIGGRARQRSRVRCRRIRPRSTLTSIKSGISWRR